MPGQCSPLSRDSTAPRPGTTRPGASSASGSRTKRRSCRRGCGTVEPGLVDLLVAVEEKVEIERAWPVLAGDADTAEALLDGEQPLEELAGVERRLERGRAVEKERLLADSDRLGLAQRRDGDDLDAVLGGEGVDGLAQRALAVAEVRAEPDVGARHGLVTVTPPCRRGPPAGPPAFGRARGRAPARTAARARRRPPTRAPRAARYCRASETSCTTRATST